MPKWGQVEDDIDKNLMNKIKQSDEEAVTPQWEQGSLKTVGGLDSDAGELRVEYPVLPAQHFSPHQSSDEEDGGGSDSERTPRGKIWGSRGSRKVDSEISSRLEDICYGFRSC